MQLIPNALCLNGAIDFFCPGQGWDIINSLFNSAPADVEVITIEIEEPFSRSPPNIIDDHFLTDFLESFNLLQEVQPQGDRLFVSEQPVQVTPCVLLIDADSLM